MEQSLIQFYLEKTGKTPQEVTPLEYEALDKALDYMVELFNSLKPVSEIQEEVESLNPKL